DRAGRGQATVRGDRRRRHPQTGGRQAAADRHGDPHLPPRIGRRGRWASLSRLAEATAPTFDLQSHSVHSDGALVPAEVVARAAAAGVTLFALSDHDNTEGVAEALAAAERAGISLVPATEITALFDGRQDLHVLGYDIDPDDPTLVAALARSRGDREHRARAMI